MDQLVTAKGNVLEIQLLEDTFGKSIRGNWDAEKIYKVNNSTYALGVHKSSSGKFYAVSMEVYDHKPKLGYSFNWDTDKVYHFNQKIRATQNKVKEIMDNATKSFEVWMYENL